MKRVNSNPDKNSNESKKPLRVNQDEQEKTSGFLQANNGQVKQNLLKSMMLLVVVPEELGKASGSNTIGYSIGAVIALLIMGYLVYSLIKPEEF